MGAKCIPAWNIVVSSFYLVFRVQKIYADKLSNSQSERQMYQTDGRTDKETKK